MSRLVGVHGVGNHQPTMTPIHAATWLSQVWTRYLTSERTASPASFDLRVAYYAHHLVPAGQQGTIGDDPTTLDPDAQAMLLAWVAQLGASAEVAQGYGSLPIRQAISWVAVHFDLPHNSVNWFVTHFFGEIATYLGDQGRRVAARDVVANLIARHTPSVVLAHSLGSVVTYETLWAYPDLHVDLLITLGSPLGMPNVVFDQLRPNPVSGYGTRPPGVARWVNLADPGDLIAIPRHLARRFHGIDLDDERAIHAFDFHRVANYLACRTAQTQLAPYLSRSRLR
jgi:hypothetical protein